MANEISVRTKYEFLDEDGTTYNYDDTYFSDSSTTASLPRRAIFTASDQGEATIALFGATPSYETHLSGPALVLIVNHEDVRELRIRVDAGAAAEESRIIPAGCWAFFDVNELDQQALGGGGSFTYGADPVTSITCISNYQSAKGEILIINKAAS